MKLFICGDSFGVPDTDYGPCWVDLLQEKISAEIVNLCVVGASNLLISLQVDKALASADAIIYMATAATRTELRVAPGSGSLLDQFDSKALTSISLHSIDHTTCLNLAQLKIAQDYTKEFSDLDLDIYRSQCIIESTLYRLRNSGIPWIFDQGGFEHAAYGAVKQYFQDYHAHRSSINIWDHAHSRKHRPYYHITDLATHQKIADYYAQTFNNI